MNKYFFEILLPIWGVIYIIYGFFRATIPLTDEIKNQTCCSMREDHCDQNSTFLNPYKDVGFNEYRWSMTAWPIPIYISYGLFLVSPLKYVIFACISYLFFSLMVIYGWSFIILMTFSNRGQECKNPETDPIKLLQRDMPYEFFLVIFPPILWGIVFIAAMVHDVKKCREKRNEEATPFLPPPPPTTTTMVSIV